MTEATTSKWILRLLGLCIAQSFSQGVDVTLSRSKRVPLIVFPPTAPTRIQFIFGIGIPEGDLEYESLTNGWVLKYEYYLPSNATQLYVPATLNIAGRSLPDEHSTNEKYNVEAVQIDTGFDGSNPDNEDFNSIDDSGDSMYEEIDTEFDELSDELRESEQRNLSKYRWALYKAMEAAADKKGLVGRSCVLKSICETARTPFHYQNGLFAELVHIIMMPSTSVDELSMHSDNEYFQAEVLGKSGASCDIIFKDCRLSFLDIFTDVLDLSDILNETM